MQVETHFQVADMLQQPLAVIGQRLVPYFNIQQCFNIVLTFII